MPIVTGVGRVEELRAVAEVPEQRLHGYPRWSSRPSTPARPPTPACSESRPLPVRAASSPEDSEEPLSMSEVFTFGLEQAFSTSPLTLPAG